MNKWYFGLPLVIVVAFGIYYFGSYAPGYHAAEEAKLEQARAARIAEQEAERERKMKAAEAIIAESERRKAEKAAREEAERKAKEERDLMRARYEKARSETANLERDVENITKEVKTEERLIEDAKIDQESFLKEKEHLKQYVSLAESNAQRMQTVVEKIHEAELARAKAAEAAARAEAEKKR